jgi:predicted HicB family RNase H-like nuclease
MNFFRRNAAQQSTCKRAFNLFVLPETLHQQLAQLAEGEGVSLNQYIVYALTRQAAIAYGIQAVADGEVVHQQ